MLRLLWDRLNWGFSSEVADIVNLIENSTSESKRHDWTMLSNAAVTVNNFVVPIDLFTVLSKDVSGYFRIIFLGIRNCCKIGYFTHDCVCTYGWGTRQEVSIHIGFSVDVFHGADIFWDEAKMPTLSIWFAICIFGERLHKRFVIREECYWLTIN